MLLNLKEGTSSDGDVSLISFCPDDGGVQHLKQSPSDRTRIGEVCCEF